jgi:hypothetical protein
MAGSIPRNPILALMVFPGAFVMLGDVLAEPARQFFTNTYYGEVRTACWLLAASEKLVVRVDTESNYAPICRMVFKPSRITSL